MTKEEISRFFFGEKMLSGFARQKINSSGELCYKGAFYLFGSKVPIYITIEPYDKFVNGEKVYKIFTCLSPVPAAKKGKLLFIYAKSINRKILEARKKVQETVKKLGVVYEYYKINKEKQEKEKCKQCRDRLNSEWKAKLREAVNCNVERQREIRKRAVQRVLERSKRNK